MAFENQSMEMPEGSLTPHQHAVMLAVWDSRRKGISATEIWKKISETRQVGRTTILSMIDRLQQRGWLRRSSPDSISVDTESDESAGTIQYFSTIGPRQARALVLRSFVQDYYGGSAKELAKSLLRWRCLTLGDMGELRDFLDQRIENVNQKLERAQQACTDKAC